MTEKHPSRAEGRSAQPANPGQRGGPAPNKRRSPMQHPTLCITLAALLCLPAFGPAEAQRVTSREISSGACMVACDDVPFCQAMDYNRQSGICTLFLNPAHAAFQATQHQCPSAPPAKWQIGFAGGKWRITCPGAASASGAAPAAPGFEGGGLEGVD